MFSGGKNFIRIQKSTQTKKFREFESEEVKSRKNKNRNQCRVNKQETKNEQYR